MPFRLTAKNFFLTYPQCPLPKHIVCHFLYDKFKPKYVIVSQEHHEDGSLHLHAVVCFTTKKNFCSPSFADLDCSPTTPYHGNYQTVRSLSDTFNYITKEDKEPFELGSRPTSSSKKETIDEIVSDIISNATSVDEFRQLFTKRAPGQFGKSYSQWMSFAESIFTAPKQQYQSRFKSFANVPPELQQWYINNVVGPFNLGFRPQSLILVGPSRLGKTEWARSLAPHVYFNQTVDFKEWLAVFKSASYQYVIFDDFSYDTFKYSYKTWFGGQLNVTVTDKYCKKYTFEHGKPTIFLTNEYPTWEGYDFDWCMQNVIVVQINTPLF